MKHFLVDVVCIAPGEPRERFEAGLLESLADAILESGGLLRPLVLVAVGPESFRVVDGHLEYWAAVRAREKDPRKGEMVNAYVVSPKSVEIVDRQLAALRRTENLRPASPETVGEGASGPRKADESIAVDVSIAAGEPSAGPSSAAAEDVLRALREETAGLERRFDGFAAALSRLESLAPRLDRVEEGILQRMAGLEERLLAPKPKSPPKAKPALPQEPFTEGALMKATLAVLKDIAKEKGVDTKGLKKKQEFADAILKHVGSV